MTLDLLAQGFDVPELTLTEIAAEADAVLDRYERLVRMPTVAPIEVEDIATSLLELEFEFVDLQSRFADRIHGATWLRRGLIMFDHEINPDVWPLMLPRFNFTFGHELGHWILHRHYFVDHDGNPMLFGDEEMSEVIHRSDGRRSQIERQADAFAACLLMPKRLMLAAWRELTGGDEPVSEVEIQRRVPNVDSNRISFVDGDDVGSVDPIRLRRETFCDPLAAKFAVSPEAMRIQLETMGLFVE